MSTITLRSVKGSGLTNNEIDANFTNLNTDKIEATQTVTLTNKTLALGSNTISGTTAQFNTALTDGDFATIAGTETLTNKTLTSPAINGGVIDTTSTTATAALGTSSTRLANTAFVQQEKEYLPALSQSLHIGAVVKAIVYDTSKDSDGGAWRKRCADKSWYTETLGGDRWIGQHATIAAAWTAAGSTTGAVYQASATAGSQTSGLFYTPTSSTTVTQVYRGVTREFPAVAGIVAESARVVIYDLATGAMWHVLPNSGWLSFLNGGAFLITSIACSSGLLVIGVGGSLGAGLRSVSFPSDSLRSKNGSGEYVHAPGNIASVASTQTEIKINSVAIVNNVVNDVAITVLDNAVLDYATGLPTPTIFVGTAGGLSTITNSGTVTNSTSTTSVVKVAADGKRLTAIRSDGTVAVYNDVTTMAVAPDTTYTASSTPATLGTAASIGNTRQAASTLGLTLLKDNPATVAAGMVAQITTAYNSGWQVGAIKGAYLADTTAETVTASGELVTNGTFTTDTSGWTAGSSSTRRRSPRSPATAWTKRSASWRCTCPAQPAWPRGRS